MNVASLVPSPASTANKAHKVRRAVPLIAGVMHVVQAIVFAGFGYPRLAALSLVAVLVFAGMAWLLRNGFSQLARWIGYAEIFAHVVFLGWVFGPAALYWIYFIPLSGGTYLTFMPDERRSRTIASIVPLLAGPAIYVLGRDHLPLVAVSSSTLAWLSVMNLVGALLGQAGIVVWFSLVAENAERAVERERDRSEKLLLNTLPAPIAARLKDGQKTISDSFPAVTVLFADLVGFTSLSARTSTDEILVLLNDIFSDFDALAEHYGLEKIKTIGDAYMVVGGIPVEKPDHAEAIARMALDMRACIAGKHVGVSEHLRIRIGIHSGPVIAGVIGTRKFAYDLWGDTVNVASRMESHGEPGQIQVSDATYALIESRFAWRERGMVALKGRGEMRTWFLDAAKT